jgi:hypothetical protein
LTSHITHLTAIPAAVELLQSDPDIDECILGDRVFLARPRLDLLALATDSVVCY